MDSIVCAATVDRRVKRGRFLAAFASGHRWTGFVGANGNAARTLHSGVQRGLRYGREFVVGVKPINGRKRRRVETGTDGRKNTSRTSRLTVLTGKATENRIAFPGRSTDTTRPLSTKARPRSRRPQSSTARRSEPAGRVRRTRRRIRAGCHARPDGTTAGSRSPRPMP